MSSLRRVADSGAEDLIVPQEIYEDANGSKWLIKVHLARVSDRIEVAGMEVRSFPLPSEGKPQGFVGVEPAKLTTALWRASFAEAEILRDRAVKDREALWFDAPADVITAWRRSESRQSDPGHQRVADIVHQAEQDGANPPKRVANNFGISVEAARKRIQRARAVGALPPVAKGRPVKKPATQD